MFDLHIRYLNSDNNPDEELISVETDDEAQAMAEQVRRGGFVIMEAAWIIAVPAHRVTAILWPAPGNQVYRQQEQG